VVLRIWKFGAEKLHMMRRMVNTNYLLFSVMNASVFFFLIIKYNIIHKQRPEKENALKDLGYNFPPKRCFT